VDRTSRKRRREVNELHFERKNLDFTPLPAAATLQP
jgi:hypothetical protein